MTDLARAIESHRDAILDLSCRLISIPSENPPGNHYREAADLIRAHLESLGFETQTCGDCILTSIGDGPRTLYFSGHYDVVPAQSRTQFDPVIQGANLFGRGSSDMK